MLLPLVAEGAEDEVRLVLLPPVVLEAPLDCEVLPLPPLLELPVLPDPPVLTEAEEFKQELEPVPIELEMAEEAEAPVLSTT